MDYLAILWKYLLLREKLLILFFTYNVFVINKRQIYFVHNIFQDIDEYTFHPITGKE